MRTILAFLCVAAASATATTIDFNNLPSIAGPTGIIGAYGVDIVSFTTVDNSNILVATTPNGTPGLLPNSTPRAELLATFTTDTVSSVSVDLGDFNSDPDLAFLEVFNASNVSLGFTSLLLDASDSSMHTLSLSASGIKYAVFGGRAPSLNGSSLFADNFSYNAEHPAIPEPSTVLLTATGLLALAVRRMRA
jgi:hypothetical protein